MSAGAGDDGIAARLGLPTYVETTGPMRVDRSGELWRARDRRRGVDVVVKVVPGVRRERLEAEARAMARVGPHLHVLAASAVGTGSDGSCWVITDLAAGGTTADCTTADAARRLAWAGQLSDAVTHLHARGVVHGDITPNNVLLDGEGRVLLADFGAAVLGGDAAEPLPGGYTPRFAAPERLRGSPAARESDVYGFGATMLDLLPGDPGVVPRRVRRLLRRCTDPRPSRRPDAAELAQRLARYDSATR